MLIGERWIVRSISMTALLGLALALTGRTADAQTFDVLITNGRVIDGSGNPWFYADVGIRDGIIAEIGSLAEADAARVIDASGLVVSPGFIDLHTHTDLLGSPHAQSKVRQGVTLDIMGGSSSAWSNCSNAR
jgi:N-acyl-D-aspartate/D-glutamate deacylase